MAPFGKGDDDHEGGVDVDPELDAEVARVEALSLSKLAAEVMAKGFNEPTAGGRTIGDIADEFRPPRPSETSRLKRARAAVRAGQQASTQGSAANQSQRLADFVGEGVQVLEHAGLVRLRERTGAPFGPSSSVTLFYVTTRLGRAALERNAVDHILGGGTL